MRKTKNMFGARTLLFTLFVFATQAFADEVNFGMSDVSVTDGRAVITLPASTVALSASVQDGYVLVRLGSDVNVIGDKQFWIDQNGAQVLFWWIGYGAEIKKIYYHHGQGSGEYRFELDLADPIEPAPQQTRPDWLPKIAIDPGHGGVDPGAVRGADQEKDLVLRFAKELESALSFAGYDLIMTRAEDSFVSLDERRRLAYKNGADLYLSFHADAIVEGSASGLTLYTLRPLPRTRVEHDILRFDPLFHLADGGVPDLPRDAQAGLAFSGLIEGRSDAIILAETLSSALSISMAPEPPRPLLQEHFAVLKMPGLPSVLVELGFMSNTRDLAQLKRQDWRARVIEGIVAALDEWAASPHANNNLR